MLAEHLRDTAATAFVFGFFAPSWFGWAQESPPRAWRRPLIAGAAVSLLVSVAGALMAWRYWSDGTAFDSDTSRTFGIVAGVELGAAALGAVALAVRRHRELIPVWIAFVVGVHLFPVAWLIRYPAVHVVAALITLAAVVSVPVARSRSITPSAVVGTATGAVLLPLRCSRSPSRRPGSDPAHRDACFTRSMGIQRMRLRSCLRLDGIAATPIGRQGVASSASGRRAFAPLQIAPVHSRMRNAPPVER